MLPHVRCPVDTAFCVFVLTAQRYFACFRAVVVRERKASIRSRLTTTKKRSENKCNRKNKIETMYSITCNMFDSLVGRVIITTSALISRWQAAEPASLAVDDDWKSEWRFLSPNLPSPLQHFTALPCFGFYCILFFVVVCLATVIHVAMRYVQLMVDAFFHFRVSCFVGFFFNLPFVGSWT